MIGTRLEAGREGLFHTHTHTHTHTIYAVYVIHVCVCAYTYTHQICGAYTYIYTEDHIWYVYIQQSTIYT